MPDSQLECQKSDITLRRNRSELTIDVKKPCETKEQKPNQQISLKKS